jgi:1-acyl-sn-glycerol-3-phosphate acyltransferase
VIYAAKHQSAWETVVLALLLHTPVFVLKRELLRLPLLGWYFSKAGCIAVDRSAGMRALRKLRDDAVAAAAGGRSILIFPQGTRVAPGVEHRYEIGVFALYEATGLPVVPVALNSGHVWGRNSWVKRPGRIDVEFLAPIEPGLSRRDFMERLETAIETRMAELDAPYLSNKPAG